MAGKPQIILDEEEVLKLAKMNCTYDEMAAFFDCDVYTLRRRYMHIIEKGREICKIGLRRAQFKAAEKGNAAILIWLGKNYLGQTDTPMAEKTKALVEKIIDKWQEDEKMDINTDIKNLEPLIDPIEGKIE